jgi:hypothetical protein
VVFGVVLALFACGILVLLVLMRSARREHALEEAERVLRESYLEPPT